MKFSEMDAAISALQEENTALRERMERQAHLIEAAMRIHVELRQQIRELERRLKDQAPHA